jgi:hypothetical protein
MYYTWVLTWDIIFLQWSYSYRCVEEAIVYVSTGCIWQVSYPLPWGGQDQTHPHRKIKTHYCFEEWTRKVFEEHTYVIQFTHGDPMYTHNAIIIIKIVLPPGCSIWVSRWYSGCGSFRSHYWTATQHYQDVLWPLRQSSWSIDHWAQGHLGQEQREAYYGSVSGAVHTII